jgi:hypothetical protein
MRVLAVGFQDGIAGALAGATTFVVRLAGGVLVLLVGVFVAKVLARVAGRVLERAGFNRAVDRGGIRRFLTHSRYEPAQILAKLVFWVVVLCALQLALGMFGPNPVSGLLDGLVAYLPRVFVAVVVVVAAGALGRFVRDLLRGVLRLTPFGHQLAAAAGIGIVVAGCFVALDQLQIAPAIVAGLWYALLVAVVGSAVVAFGVGGIPVARRYLERAADDLDTRYAKLNAVRAAERAAARANRAAESHTPSATVDAGNGQTVHGVAKPGVGYPVEPGAAYPSPDRPAGSYGADVARIDGTSYDATAYPAGSAGRDSQLTGQSGYDRPEGRGHTDDRAGQGLTRQYGDVSSSSRGGYPTDRPSGPRPPGDQRRPQPPGGQAGAAGEYPRGVPRPFDDGRSRGYSRGDARQDDDYGDPPDANGFGETYPYPR